jgi:DNA-binding Lrp family transcriptional regulator
VLPPPITADRLAAIEEAVAGGAGRDAEALERLLAGQAEPLRLRARGQHDGIGEIDGAAIALGAERAGGEVEPRDVVEDDLATDGAGVRLHLHHQLGALDHLLADPVLDIGGDGELTARLDALNDDRLQHGARGVDSRGVAGGAGPDDQISAPPCLRRVRTLEESGYIRGYHAEIDPRALGFEVQVFAMVGLQSQAQADLSAFEERCRNWPLVRECHMLNGEVDFILKCVAPDLSTFQTFLTDALLDHAQRGQCENVAGDPRGQGRTRRAVRCAGRAAEPPARVRRRLR